jgi:hypothetical protein
LSIQWYSEWHMNNDAISNFARSISNLSIQALDEESPKNSEETKNALKRALSEDNISNYCKRMRLEKSISTNQSFKFGIYPDYAVQEEKELHDEEIDEDYLLNIYLDQKQ